MSDVMADFMQGLEAHMKDFRENVRVQGEITFPIEVNSVQTGAAHRVTMRESGAWVSIRPCQDEKTYLGVYLGDLNLDILYQYHIQKKEITFYAHANPAIWVPDLKRVVWGCESWWGPIKSPEDLHRITDADIQNVWYVRALKELQEQQTESA